ncbi:hypothetical protein DXB59_13660 [Ruminococcus sp. OM05-10BH]|nr:hypothetical protein DXB59_13660 [Ruminococcus sp. OM05-10BH]
MRKITDFGEKIGGARKDLWRTHGIQEEDLHEMTEEEKKYYVTRENVWPLANARKLVEEEGAEPWVVYWQRKVRLLVYKSPVVWKGEDFAKQAAAYVAGTQEVKRLVMACRTEEDVRAVEQEIDGWFTPVTSHYFKFRDDCLYRRCISSKVYLLKYQHGSMKNRVEISGFPFEQKAGKKRAPQKKAFVPPQLQGIERGGEDYRHGIHVTPEKWQDVFSFRAVEFGNWLSQKDRQASMDYCFDALKDLALALEIEDQDIAFGTDLALAFGARGQSGASAHYEPLRRVINLTKMRGAGCTAHEWFHALDHHLASHYRLENKTLASEGAEDPKLPESFRTLIRSLKTDYQGNPTDFYRGSKQFDRHFRKESYGYWAGSAEMAARAFACYVKDCLGYKSDYLIAHADVYEFEFDNLCLCAHPQGEERELYNELFDQLFYDLKKEGFFHQRKVRIQPKQETFVAEAVAGYHVDYRFPIGEEGSGQYMFRF